MAFTTKKAKEKLYMALGVISVIVICKKFPSQPTPPPIHHNKYTKNVPIHRSQPPIPHMF